MNELREMLKKNYKTQGWRAKPITEEERVTAQRMRLEGMENAAICKALKIHDCRLQVILAGFHVRAKPGRPHKMVESTKVGCAPHPPGRKRRSYVVPYVMGV